MLKYNFIIWIIAFFAILLVSDDPNLEQFIVPLLAVSFIAALLARYQIKHIEYFLFFSISIASFLGFTETLTGSHAESTNAFLFGLSFYTASMAYLISRNKFSFGSIFAVSNPLLLSTGPIVLFFKSISYKSVKKRFEYYFPFVIIGIFMFKVVASPLTEFFFLLEKTDLVSAIIFAAIFELFVYMNFCGLSLLIYGLFGLIGYRVPLNFKQPFSSNNIVEFWRGWHLSLSQVLKVLFYQPLRSRFSVFYALMGVYIASAMWHGVTFNFFLWGTFHAFFFWLSIKLLKNNFNFISFMLMPFVIVIGRLIFADSNTIRLLEKLKFNFDGFEDFYSLFNVPNHSFLALIIGVLIIAIEFMFRNTKIMKKRNYKFLRTPIALFILCLYSALFISNVGVEYAVYGQR